MRTININTKEFLECLEVVGNAIPSKSAIPSLTSVLIKFEEGRIILLGSDGSISIKKVMFANEINNFVVEEKGVCLVDFKILKAIVGKVDDEILHFNVEDNQFVIRTPKGTYKLNLLNEQDYPSIDFKRLENEINISTKNLKDIIKYTYFSCSTNERRPILTGINFQIENDSLVAVSTDSFRLSQMKTNIRDTKEEKINFTFPKNSLIVLEKLISKTKEEDITLLYGNSNEILINVDNTLYKTRMLSGAYPSVSGIVDMISTPNYTCSINRNALYNGIEIVNIFNAIDYRTITLNFVSDGYVEITNRDTEVGNGKKVISCPSCDFNLKISCSSEYLLDALKCYESEEVQINMNESLKPFTITSTERQELLELLLPIKSE